MPAPVMPACGCRKRTQGSIAASVLGMRVSVGLAPAVGACSGIHASNRGQGAWYPSSPATGPLQWVRARAAGEPWRIQRQPSALRRSGKRSVVNAATPQQCGPTFTASAEGGRDPPGYGG